MLVEELRNLALHQIEDILQSNKKSLKDYTPMSYPTCFMQAHHGNRYIYAEQNYDKVQLQRDFQTYFTSLTGLQ